MAFEWMTGINEWLASANGIWRDDQDKSLISFSYSIRMDDWDK